MRVLVVGGGAVGVRRARMLGDAGAHVTVVAPDAGDLPESCVLIRRRFEASDVQGFTHVIAATDDAAVNGLVGEACRGANVPVCRADDAAAGDFTFMLATRVGPVLVGVSSGVPAVTRRAADAVAGALAPLADHARAVAALRPTVLAATPDAAVRRAALADASSDEAADVVRRDGMEGLRLWLASRHPAVAGALTGRW